MARSDDYEKQDSIRYDCEESESVSRVDKLSELRWESQLPVSSICRSGVETKVQLGRQGASEGSSGHDCSCEEPISISPHSIGSCCSKFTPSDDRETPQLTYESDSSPSSLADQFSLKREGFRTCRMSGDDDDDGHDSSDSGEDVSGATLQKQSIRVISSPSSYPSDEGSEGNHPITSMNHATKLTKKPSLKLSTKQLSDSGSSKIPTPSICISSPSPTLPCIQIRNTLRRRDGINIFRRSAPMPEKDDLLLVGKPPITPRPQSQPVLSSSSPSPCTSITHKPNSSSTSIPITSLQSHARSLSQPNSIRLGHPNRPYYSAIRKDMSSSPDATRSSYSRPASPPSSFPFPINNHAHMSMSLQSVDRQSSEDMVPELATFGYSAGAAIASESIPSTIRKRQERHRSAPALSKKEEMELRLALARNVRGPTEDPDVGRQPGASDTFKRKMDKLRRGIKDIWRRRS